MLKYKDMTFQEVHNLNKDKTILLLALSPIETHGPHLPLGTDLIISEKLLLKYKEEIEKKYPNHTVIKIPSLPFGSSLLPVDGSLEIKTRLLEKILYNYIEQLAKINFKYLFIIDNHGGPTHQMAIQAVTNKIYKKHNFYAIDLFNYFFRLMIENNKELLDRLVSEDIEYGDDKDLHAGSNETSLLLYLSKENVGNYQDLKDSTIPNFNGLSKYIYKIARTFNSKSLYHLAVNLAWINDKNMIPYLGCPTKANADKGKEMIDARVNIGMKIIDKVLSDQFVEIKPILWKLRILRYFH
ncbi:MAG: creatininase family protein [Halanaerobiales bacterium]|nr:creatininase family protein [Halanaerobiales bacterium]MCF8008310.1 creatininase family protein [Halanaerobiales bacterium]